MATIQDVPPEIMGQILTELDPTDVASVSQTCSAYFDFIYHPTNELLWRELYLSQILDDPRTCLSLLGHRLPEIGWRDQVKRIIRARTVVRNPGLCRIEERCAVMQTLLDVAVHTKPRREVSSGDLSYNHVWLVTLLRTGIWFDQHWDLDYEGRQIRARFHTYFGLTTNDYTPNRLLETRSIVYAMRNYREANEWGPFDKHGSGMVDWEHILAIHHVMSMHIVPTRPVMGFMTFPMSLPFCQSVLPPGLDLDETLDWVGIEGLWECSFAFCDHRQLLAFNNNDRSDSLPLDSEVFHDTTFQEIFSTISIRLRVTSTVPNPAHPKRPMIHFVGGIEDQSHMHGWVKLTPDHQIRWHFESGQLGNYIWSSEGIQIGNVRSIYGVLGAWTTVQHDRGDPVGPFWMRKIPVDIGV